MPRFPLALVLPVFLLFPLLAQTGGPAGAPSDEAILAAIDGGRASFVSGKEQETIEQLQRAIGMIQERAARGLASFLPARDQNLWELGEVDTQTGNWGSGESTFQWTQVSRRYVKKGPESIPEVTVMISNSPPLIAAQQGMVQMLKDPAMRKLLAQGGQELDFIEQGGWVGMITTEGEDCNALVFHEKVMIQIQASRGDAELVREFWSAMNRSGLAASR